MSKAEQKAPTPAARDAWWCRIVNEPFIVEFVGDSPKCSLCGWVGQDIGAEHVFCAHIEKPEGAK